MDSGNSRLSRNLSLGLTVRAAAVVTWFLLTFLFKYVPEMALPLLLLTSLFLIVLVLIQRGKGGGLAGAFGGMGGQSAFGTKAGDLFTRVTMGAALFWIILCMATVSVLGTGRGGPLDEDVGGGTGNASRQMSPLKPDDPGGDGAQKTPSGSGDTPNGQDGGSQ